MGQKQVRHQGTFSFVLEHFEGFRSMLVIMSVISILTALSKVASPIISQILVDNVLSGISPQWGLSLITIAGALCLFTILSSIPDIMTWRQNMSMSISSKSQYFWHALRLPVSFYSDKYAGDIAGRLNYSSEIVNNLKRIFLLAGDASLIVIYLFFMIKYSAVLSIFAIFHIIISLSVVRLTRPAMVRSRATMQNELDILQGFTSSGIENIDAIKGASGEKIYLNKWSDKLAASQNTTVKCIENNIKITTLPLLLEAVANTLVLGIGAYYIIKGYLTAGMLMTFQSFMAACMKPVSHIVELEQSMTSIKVKAERQNEIFDAECDVPDSLESIDGIIDEKLHGEIELRNVTFGYDRSQAPIIKDFNLHLMPGRSVAFVGGSGSGKSTIAKLISGIYKPWSGEILFDGHPADGINREVFANSLSVVDQNIVLFDGTIAENIKMWSPAVEDFAMILACHDAQIHNDIVIRKGAYNAEVESGGKNFSGGQRQRLELATAFAKEPSIIIMDEGTSALDAVTEDNVMKNIQNMGCSLIIIAHRLSTIRNCDEIIVLNNGVVEERGSHDELMANNGTYCRLVEN